MRKGNDWEVYDIVIEGVSLVNNYRTQFSRIINQTSYEGLVKRMRTEAQGAAAERRGASQPASRPSLEGATPPTPPE